MFDRLGAASPVPGQRSYSPAARRPSPLAAPARGQYNPRSTSLSLLSRTNSSTESLPRPSREVNGSALRREPLTVPDFEDPLQSLERIVGLPLPVEHVDAEKDLIEKPTALSVDIDLEGLSLEDFAARKPEATTPARRYNYSAESAEEYEKESARFEDLHKSILACDDVLKSVETSLGGFQKDLAAVSTEIEELQTRSIAMNTKLENRRVVEGLLGPAVESVAISPWAVRTISDGPINEQWLKALAELQKRIKIVGSKHKDAEGSPSKAVTDMTPMLENLSARACGKIRDHMVAQIKAFRSPGINAQIIQQNLVKFKDIYSFLSKAQPQLASDLIEAYVNTMRWYYSSHFERYRLALGKLTIATDVISIGTDPTKAKPASTPVSRDPFALGHRADVLNPNNTAAISSYLAEEDKTPRTLEFPFRSFNQALIDNVCAEHAFVSAFFAVLPPSKLDKYAVAIFRPTFTLGTSLASDLLQGSIDCLGILLCLRLTQHFTFSVQRRTVPTADTYLNGLNMLLWPRFQQAMDAHTESIKSLEKSGVGGGGGGGAGSSGASASAASKLAFASAGGDPAKLSTAPHVLTQRVAQLLHGLAVLSAEARVEEEPVARSVARLRGEFEGFLKQASKGVGADAKKRERFLGNNHALVLTILGDARGGLASDLRTHFEDLQGKAKA